MTPCFLADCTVRGIKQVAARGLMVDSPCPHIASHISVAKWAPVNQTFLFHNTILHRKTVPTDPSMVYVPCRHVTGHMPIARGTRTHTIIRFCTEASFPHSETVTACAAVIDLACAYSAAWSQTDRNEDTRIGNSCLSPSGCCLPVVVVSVPFSSLQCFAFGASSSV